MLTLTSAGRAFSAINKKNVYKAVNDNPHLYTRKYDNLVIKPENLGYDLLKKNFILLGNDNLCSVLQSLFSLLHLFVDGNDLSLILLDASLVVLD